MSDMTTPPSPIDAAPSAPWPFPRRLVALYTRPRALFEHLADRPSFLVPLIVLVLALLVFILTTWDKAWLPMIHEGLEKQDAPEASYEMFQNNGLAIYSVMVPVMVAVSIFLHALGVMFMGGFLLGGRMSYRQALSIVTHAGLVTLVALPIKILLARAAENPQVTLGPGALLPVGEQEGFVMKFLAVFLSSFDVFTLWQTVLVGLGISVVGRVGLKPAMIVSFGLFVLFALFSGVLGAFGG